MQNLVVFEGSPGFLWIIGKSNSKVWMTSAMFEECFIKLDRRFKADLKNKLTSVKLTTDALICALEVKAAYNTSRTSHKVRVAELQT